MTVTALVDAAITDYKGDSLQCVLIGSDRWPGFLSETGLVPQPVEGGDVEVWYKGVPCRPSVTPHDINLIVGD